MNLWAIWLDLITGLINGLVSDTGLQLGIAIILATIILRFALLPISWSITYRGVIRQKKLIKLQPELVKLRDAYSDKPDMYMQRMMSLYHKHDVAFFDGQSLIAALVQFPLLLGMFQVLRNIGDGVRFLWVQNLLKPDFWLALIAGITTMLMIIVNPDMPDQARLFMIIIPSVLATLFALKFSSALAIYWATSNCFTAAQTIAVHYFVGCQINSGKLKL